MVQGVRIVFSFESLKLRGFAPLDAFCGGDGRNTRIQNAPSVFIDWCEGLRVCLGRTGTTETLKPCPLKP